MITADTFEMIETITRGALERHPVWTPYEAPEDRDTILSWGVPAKILDDEIARYESCGPQPLFPVLQCDPLPRRAHLFVSVSVRTACGIELPGYLLAPNAFGVFVDDQEICFNRHLPSLSERAARSLGSALAERPERLFPLRYASDLRTGDGRAVGGEIERFW
jgi:hypothetical protein